VRDRAGEAVRLPLLRSWHVVVVIALIAIGVALWWATRADARAPTRTPETTRGSAPAAHVDGAADEEVEAPAPSALVRLEGQVIGADEEPIAGAEVHLVATPPRALSAEDDGTFAFDRVVPGRYTVYARLGGRIASETIDVDEGSPPVILIVGDGGEIAVRVRRADGAAIPRARVATLEPFAVTASTDERGAATLAGVPPGMRAIAISAPGFATAHSVVTVPADAPHRVDLQITLQAGATIAGAVVDERGAAIPRAEVTLASNAIDATAAETLAITTDADGLFELGDLAPGSMRVRASDGEHAPAEAVVELPAGGRRDGVTLVLTRGGAIRGVVTGAPPAGVAVVAVPAGAPATSPSATRGTVDRTGQFQLRGLAAGHYEVLATVGSASSPRVATDVEAGAVAAVELAMPPPLAIAGVVVDSEGAGVARARVVAAAEDGRSSLRTVTADEDGRFTIADLDAGAYRVRADWPGARDRYRLLLDAGVVARAGDAQVRVELTARATLRGRVVQHGRPATAFLVRVGAAVATPVRATDGRFEIADLPAGTQWITITGETFDKRVLEDIALRPGDTTDLGDIEVSPGRSVRGRVIDDAGSPVAGARVVAGEMIVGTAADIVTTSGLTTANGFRVAVSDRDGRYAIRGLGAGASVIVADHAARGRSEVLRLDAADGDAVVDLALRPTVALRGRLRHAGLAAADAMVAVSHRGAGNGRFLARTHADGAFAFERLAPGEHVVTGYVPLAGGVECGVSAIARGDTVELTLPAGAASAAVAIDAQGRRRIGLVYLSTATLDATTASRLEAEVQDAGDGFTCTGVARPDAPLVIGPVPAGAYTACVVSIPHDPDDPSDAVRVQERAGSLPVVCRAVELAAGRAALTVPLP
jgi:hypothetical protein